MKPSDRDTPPSQVTPGAFAYNRGVVKRNYAVMPPEGILPSVLPAFEKTIVRFQAAPAIGARFAQILLEIEPNAGTIAPIDDQLEHFIYVLSGEIDLTIAGDNWQLGDGGYAYVPTGAPFAMRTRSDGRARVLHLKRPYVSIDLPAPDPLVSSRSAVESVNHTGTKGRAWQHLLPVGDMRFDMEMNILSFAPGTYFPDLETHIMEHGLYMLEGHGLYHLENDWHEVWQGDFIWMGPYCPQQFYALGWEQSSYLLYKDVNRDVVLG
jgi:(S)-ureidoglycine aminohydrolase